MKISHYQTEIDMAYQHPEDWMNYRYLSNISQYLYDRWISNRRCFIPIKSKAYLCMVIVNWAFWNKLQRTFNRNYNIFVQEGGVNPELLGCIFPIP